MKNLLIYNYSITVDTFQNIDAGITFYIDYDKYYFLELSRLPKELLEINDILTNHINPYHFIIKNKLGDIITTDGNKNYCLIKIRGPENDEMTLKEMLYNLIEINKPNSILRRDNWGLLWSEKVDYLEYQISELGTNHPIILSSFSYYVGLAENAIEYFNLIDNKNEKLVLSQKRIKYPNISRNYFNPLNLVIDNKTRDLSEYLKSCFFENGYPIDELTDIIKKHILNQNEYNLLYSRLLYPSYYFDELSEILEKNKKEDVLLKYINKVNNYEEFLKKVYLLLSRNCKMIKIDWINNHQT